MHTGFGELTYCTNIHAGESWTDHFAALKAHVPFIKTHLSPDQSFGLGLRLSNAASVALAHRERLIEFKSWLSAEKCYVFTMNGFPYGGFHNTVVKDQVHAPDWQTKDRVDYTLRLFNILNEICPGDEGGISTSPLSYKHWYLPEEYVGVFRESTRNIIHVIEHLVRIHDDNGKILHLDIEPEPDGLIESGPEFITWFEKYLLPMGITQLKTTFNVSDDQAGQLIRRHLRLCYDVCHFAVGFEDHSAILEELRRKEICVGKVQISAALKARIPDNPAMRQRVFSAFEAFNEPTYLHQVVADHQGELIRYRDLPEALSRRESTTATEWRSHFHVPIFVESYDVLQSTQEDIRTVLTLQKENLFTQHLEVETYTWEVLPKQLQAPIAESIVREVNWVRDYLES